MEKKNGVVEKYYENIKLKSRTTYKDGKRDGLSESWNDNCQVWTRANYKDGELDGFIDWWHNGQLKINSKMSKTQNLTE